MPSSSSSVRLRGLAALSAGAVLLASTAGRAEPSASERKLARDMLHEAIADEKAGKCQEAVDALRQVAAIVESGETLLHLGECLSRTGHLLEAIKTWERAEDLARRDKDKTTQQALIPKLSELHGRIPTVALHVPPDAANAAVTIDGQALSLERTKAPIELDPGDHTVEVKAEGRSPFTTRLTLAEKATVAVSAVLPSLQPAGDGSSGSGTRVGAWIAGSAALVLAGGGVGAFVAAGGAASDGRAACATRTRCDPSAIKSVHQLDTAALALWIGAGAGLGLSITLFVASSPREKPAPKAAGEPLRLRIGPRSLLLTGTF